MYQSYVYYLEKKGKDELSGIEQTVSFFLLKKQCWENFQKYNVNWCPIGQTGYLGEIKKEPDNKLQNQINGNTTILKDINSNNQEMLEKMRKMDEILTALDKVKENSDKNTLTMKKKLEETNEMNQELERQLAESK